MKAILTATAIALAIPMGMTGGTSTVPQAKADVNVSIGIGVPHYYRYRVGADYIYRKGHGWYRPANGKMSCNQARSRLSRTGYNGITARDCQGATYVFSARKNGHPVKVYVNARTGATWRG